MPLGIKPTVDFAFKKIFGSPENAVALIGLLNAILDLARPITEVEILNPFSLQDFDGDKEIVLDISARDSTGRRLNIEMQISAVRSLLPRMVYYACSLYTDQLTEGGKYVDLKPAISICLLSNNLFKDSRIPHHRFRLCDPENGREIGDSIEVHTVELLKYNLSEATISMASNIEKWAFFFLYADRYDAATLLELLPGAEFQQAISSANTIAQKTEDKQMYDQRHKAQLDSQWLVEGALQQGREEGREEGLEQGLEQGLEKGALIGTIGTLQQILGEAVSPSEDLAGRSLPELGSIVDDLQRRLRERNV